MKVQRRIAVPLVRLFLSAAIGGVMATAGVVIAQAPQAQTSVTLVAKEDADVFRIQLETPVGALSQVTLLQGARPSLRMELKGVSMSEAQARAR